MIKDKNIICFAPTDWWGQNPSCTTHIMEKLGKKNRILYVNPFSSDFISSISSGKAKQGLWNRINRKLKSMVKVIRKVNDNLFIFTPFFLPLQGIGLIDIINDFMIKSQLKCICFLLNMKNPVVWAENIRADFLLEKIKAQFVIFHVSDLYSENDYIISKASVLKKREQNILNKCDLVVCVSEQLFEIYNSEYENVYYIPHGVDYNLFHEASLKPPLLSEIKDIKHPVVGYFGTLTEHNDIELLKYCASKLPNISFVYAGLITSGDYDSLDKFENVYLIGKMPYSKIPSLCSNFDVCILPWIVDEWILHCNPLKLFEYMAAGKKVVSVEINELKKYKDVLSVTHTHQEFCDAIIWELDNDNKERSDKRKQIAEANSWDSHVENLSDLMAKTLCRV